MSMGESLLDPVIGLLLIFLNVRLLQIIALYNIMLWLVGYGVVFGAFSFMESRKSASSSSFLFRL